MPSNLRLSRDELRQIVGDKAKWIRAFEEMQQTTTEIVPDQINLLLTLITSASTSAESAAAYADDAQKAAEAALATFATIADQSRRIDELEGYLAALQIAAGEQALMNYDDFSKAEFLADQISAGAVLTFTFTQPQQQIWVELSSATATNTARARTDGVNPSATVGALLRVGAPLPMLDTSMEVRVLATAGDTVTVYGYSR